MGLVATFCSPEASRYGTASTGSLKGFEYRRFARKETVEGIRSCVGCLARASSSRSSSTVWSEISTPASSTLVPWSTLIEPATTSLVHSSTRSSISVSTISVCLWSTGLDIYLFTPNGVRVRGSSSSISLGGCIFNESAILR